MNALALILRLVWAVRVPRDVPASLYIAVLSNADIDERLGVRP